MHESGRGNHEGYERRDASMRVAMWIGVGLVVAVVAAILGMKVLFRMLEEDEIRRQPEPASLTAGAEPTLPPEPRLEADPLGSLEEMRAGEERALSSYGWIDEEAGIVRIPIERAMELTLERGLPVVSGAAAAGGAVAGEVSP
jgi:hypothetical protein